MQYTIVVLFCCVSALAAQTPSGQQLRKELESPYTNWLKIDVAYIITDPEREAFNRLSNDDEREQFIEQFWFRRDPTPDTEENEFKEEHYRRIAYANERFASGIPGWKTDRGRIYIKYGPPDEIESHPTGGSYQRPLEQGGGATSTYPFEQWRYRYLEDIGNDVVIEFVDSTNSGEYRLAFDPSEKDALSHVPGYQPPFANRAPHPSPNELDRVERMAALGKPPAVKFKDLEAAVTSKIRYNALPMKVRADFIPLTPASVLTSITLQFDRKDLQFQQQSGVAKAVVNLYGRVTNISWHPVSAFDDVVTVEVASGLLANAVTGSSVYQKSLPLAPGTYRLNLVAKDAIGGNIGTYETTLNVPRSDEEKLQASSLILADLLERLPAKNIGAGAFAIGDIKVRPRPGTTFANDEKLGFYVQLYHFAPDPVDYKPRGSIEYQVVNNDSHQTVLNYTEEVRDLPGATSQVIVEKLIPLASLAPGSYTLKLRVTDRNRNQTITPSADFIIISSPAR